MATTARITQAGRSNRRRGFLCRNVSLALPLLALLAVAPRAIAIEENQAITNDGLMEAASVDEGKEKLFFDGDATAIDGTLSEADAVLEEVEIEVEGKVVKIDMPLAEVVIEEETAVIPDITQLTLDSLSLTDGGGSAANLLTLGDLSNILDLRNLTIGAAITRHRRHELQALTLDQYGFLADMTISEVADMAGLYSKTVGEVPIVETAILTFLNHPVLVRERKVTLSRFLSQYPEIGSIKLGLLELPKYHYSAIPKLLNVPITSVPDWQQLKVSSIVGLKELPIHQNLQIDGEIVTLTTARMEKRTEIQLKQGEDFSATWSETLDDNAFQPFDSFFLKPRIAGETIRIDAYFKSCTDGAENCQFVGPFAYPSYKVGNPFYVSQADWQSVVAQEKQSIGFKREPAPVVEETSAPFFESRLLKIVALGTFLTLTGGAALLWFKAKSRKEAQS